MLPWIQTYTSKQFWPLNPKTKDICLLDIVWALSQKCRYTGHCNRFYSILEHSLLVNKFCPNYPLEGLFHDAAEAYLPDVASPLKCLPFMSEFKKIENRILEIIFKKFELTWPLPEEVDLIDKAMVFDERQELMPDWPVDWEIKGPGLGLPPLPKLDPLQAAFSFLRICERNGIK